MKNHSSFAERLLAYAAICRKLASECWNEEVATELERLAQECLKAARIDGSEADDERLVAIK